MGYNSDMRTPGRILAPALLGVLVAIMMVVPLPFGALGRNWPGLAAQLQNSGHPLAFGVLAYCTFPLLRARWPRARVAPYAWMAGGAALFGAATEVVQALFGREASWLDFGNDLAGAAIALLLRARQETAAPARRRVVLLAALAVAVGVAAPLAVTVAAYVHRAALGPGVIWRAGTPLSAGFAHLQAGAFPGVVIDEPIADWRPWRHLEIELESLETGPMRVFVRAHDLVHQGDFHDRYNEGFILPAGARQILRIPVARIGDAPATRTMDLSAMRGMIVFARADDPAHRFLVHEIRLADRHDQVLVPSRP